MDDHQKQAGMGKDEQFDKDKINQPSDTESETGTGTGTEGQTDDQSSETSKDTGFQPS